MNSVSLSVLLAQLSALAVQLNAVELALDLDVLERYFADLGSEKVSRRLKLSSSEPEREPLQDINQWQLPNFMDSTALVLKSAGGKKGADILTELANCLRNGGVQSAREFVDRSRAGQQASKKRTASAPPDQGVIETHAAKIESTITSVQSFGQAFAALKLDKRAGRMELREIAKRITNVEPQKNASREALLKEIRSHHVVTVRDLAKSHEINQQG